MTEPTAPPFDPEVPLPGLADPVGGSGMPPLRDGPPWAMTDMMAAEPALAERLLTRLADPDGAAAALADRIDQVARRGEPIRFVGCGTSEHGAMASALILEAALARTGSDAPVVSVQAFEASLAPRSGGLVIGVSHEGGTAATNAALAAARSAGAETAIVTVSDRSPGAGQADIVVATDEADQSWCHTVGYLSPILAAVAVAGHLTGQRPDPAAVRSTLAAGLDQPAVAEAIAARLADATTILTVASGADRPAGRELALKIEEATWLPTTMRELETLLHGHMPSTGPSTGLVLILADDDHLEARAARAAQALDAASVLGLRTAAILSAPAATALDAAAGAGEGAPTPAGRLVAHRPRVEGPGAALLASATPLQLLTERLARARGTNPDPIRRQDDRYREASERHH
ncbi:MAG: SIS domain-containing protein [Candidatus Limnocylindrales bacterium]|jgi:fructoselysine-6-P-deglycase FrlB-like protein